MEEQESLFGFEVDQEMGREINELSKWTKLFSIIVFCMIGICVLVLGVAWSKLETSISEQTGDDASVYMATLAGFGAVFIIYFGIMVYFLLRSAGRLRKALYSRDQAQLNNGFADLKTYFVMMGIMSLLSIFFTLISYLF